MRLVVLALAALSGPALAIPATQPLQPTSAWNLDYAQEECRLSRSFGSGDDQLVLRIARGGSIGAVDMVLAGKGLPRLPSRIGVKVSMPPKDTVATASAYSMPLPGPLERFLRWNDTSLALLDVGASAGLLRIDAGDKFTVLLNATQFSAAMTALQTCYVDLLKGWGVDDASIERIITVRSPDSRSLNEVTAQRVDRPVPKGNVASWVTPDDYPTEALRQELSGVVIVVLGLDPSGRPEKCHVAVSSKVPVLDEQTCAVLMRRARYQPVSDAFGSPTRTATVERVRWLIPTD